MRAGQGMVDMTKKVEPDLDARLEAQVQASRAVVRSAESRINWDVEPHFSLRKRIADSWQNKNDLYAKGDNMYRFCKRVHMARATLCRYLKKLKNGVQNPSKRGRKTHLSESVMRHICEGSCLFN